MSSHFARDADTLRDLCLVSANAAWGYIDWRVLSVATSLPWSLCLGSLDDNLAWLCNESEPPPEPISARIWQLHSMGVPDSVLLDGLSALRQASWTSQVSERQHASTSLMRKHHPDYGLQALLSRSWLHFLNLFVAKKTCLCHTCSKTGTGSATKTPKVHRQANLSERIDDGNHSYKCRSRNSRKAANVASSCHANTWGPLA
eukprot:6461570-Amphidinium_carterae.2